MLCDLVLISQTLLRHRSPFYASQCDLYFNGVCPDCGNPPAIFYGESSPIKYTDRLHITKFGETLLKAIRNNFYLLMSEH